MPSPAPAEPVRAWAVEVDGIAASWLAAPYPEGVGSRPVEKCAAWLAAPYPEGVGSRPVWVIRLRSET